MPPRRNTRRRRIEEVYGDGNPPPNQLNPEISKAVQQTLNSMMSGLITQVVKVVRQAGGTTTPNNAGGTGLTSSDEVHVNARYHKYTLSDKYNVLEGNLQASSAPEDVRTSSASRERSSAAEGLRDLRIFPKMLRRLSSIRFERCTPSLSSSADLRLHRTFV
ncbi:hypothetical protein L6452_02487 [Arctium lappa]|uniref:Uncharacterized protein n=1 Tax=Arctium lappa TaxID=4217 RepID=A0ACB9FKJ3_ARCLA|nr:hypothetical protein L6452_02487 [Arctium lappa]